jgi:ATP-dependent RNA helicase RhlE
VIRPLPKDFMTAPSFESLSLIEPLQAALRAEGYVKPTPIQAAAIPDLLLGRDLLGCAQTGTGKTAAFALPILQRLHADRRHPGPRATRVLVLAPTRELASQIGERFSVYGARLGFKYAVIFGGVGQNPQVSALSRGVDVLVATPGRLLDLMQQGYVRLDHLEVFVLDEADRMLDMGFIHDIRKVIAKLPPRRQTLLFSATMPDDIARLADSLLHKPVKVEVTPAATTAEKVEQLVLFVDKGNKPALLTELLSDPEAQRVLVFSRTKHGANRIAKHLMKDGVVAEAIHGNKSQSARERALEGFRTGRVRALIATDIAARGIDVDGISHVINFDLPNIPESYVHRIGRTARAGASGVALSFCDAEERAWLRDIEKTIRQKIPVVQDHPYPARNTVEVAPPPLGGGGRSGGRGGRGGRTGGRPSGRGAPSSPGRRAGPGHAAAARSSGASTGGEASRGRSFGAASPSPSGRVRRRWPS